MPKAWCLIIDHEYKAIGMPFLVPFKNKQINIASFKEKVMERRSKALKDVDDGDLIIWQCKEVVVPADVGRGQLQALIKEINFLDEAEAEVLLVQVPTLKLASADTVAKRLRFSEAQELDVEAARRALPPSSAATMPTFQNEQEKRPVLNGRPHYNSGLPVGLFHPVFNSFQATMRRPERFYADEATYSSVKALFKAFAGIYETEKKRADEIDKHLPALLGTEFIVVEAPGVKSDRVAIQSCGSSTAYVAIRELKNEIGTANADPYNQGSLAYRRYWVGKSQDVIRNRCHCPSIIIAIAGPWLCVLGGVYLQKAVIQPLTDYVWLGGDNFNEDRLLFASRLFSALRTAISALRSYYMALAPTLSNPVSRNLTSDPFPYITQYGLTTFKYLSRLAPDYPNKLLYRAELDNEHRIVVVKFASTYNAVAHRMLAEHQLAPTLHYAGTEDAEASMYGGRYMIVMDFAEGETAVDSLTDDQFEQVEEAIRLLHSQNLVFGDLRPPNILVTGEAVMLVDFDWCGREGEARYPASLNTDEELGWPEGVKPDSAMTMAHDRFMLEKLRSPSIQA